MRDITGHDKGGIDRRSFLGLMAAAAAAGPASAAAKPFFASRKLPVGIQLYSLGDLPRTDLAGTMKQLKAIGYKTVELAGYLGKTPAELRVAFDEAGIACPSAHVGLRVGTAQEPNLLGDIGKLAADLHVIGASDVVCPSYPAPEDVVSKLPANGRSSGAVAALMTPDHWKQIADQLNTAAAKLKTNGLRLGYHNHNSEFAPVAGRTGWDILIAETDPKLVFFELDIGWAASAGLDPAKVFAKNPGRYRSAHLKDIKASTLPNFNNKMDPTEVGSGKLDWGRILPAAHKAGVRNFFVEQEPPFAFTRIESAAKCYAYLSTLKA